MENQSRYDPSRKTVGAIYREANLSYDGTPIETGDMARELMSSLVEDLNDTINSRPHEGRPYYITVHEKKDLQMKTALLRRIITTLYRPWPEDDTTVFYINPSSSDVRFCWCLPHWTDMDNVMRNEMLYPVEYVKDISAWKSLDLYRFGFTKDPMGHWIPNERWIDKKLEAPAVHVPKLIIP